MTGLSDRVMLSMPHRIHFGGFEATLPRLQQAGWEISAEQSYMRDEVRLALRNETMQFYGVTHPARIDFYRYRAMAQYRVDPREFIIDFHVARMSHKLMVDYVGAESGKLPMQAFEPIDAQPQWSGIRTSTHDMESLGIFATPLTRTQELIVDPNDVAALLDRIKDLQRPEQEAIRERRRLKESREGMLLDGMPRQVFHAQILSIAA